jgi:uncharacterized protein
MIDQLPHQIPWYICGPALGVLVAGLYAVANKPLGASGAYVQTLNLIRREPVAEAWRAWYFVGILAGAVAFSLIRGTPPIGWHYGALGSWLPLAALVPLLFVAGSLIGYGARWMGGCTSGHGLCGTSSLNPPSFVATGTFVGTGIVATAILHVVTGGAI